MTQKNNRKQSLVANADWVLTLWDTSGNIISQLTFPNVPELRARRRTNEEIKKQNRYSIVAKHELVPYKYYFVRIEVRDGEHEYYFRWTERGVGMSPEEVEKTVIEDNGYKWDNSTDSYEQDRDYRLYRIDKIVEITRAEYETLNKYL